MQKKDQMYIITEQGDLGLGLDPLTENEQKIVENNQKNEEESKKDK